MKLSRGQGMRASLSYREVQKIIELQTPGGETQPDPSLQVVNPTYGTSSATVWDADDSQHGGVAGNLLGGETFVFDIPFYVDWCQGHTSYIEAYYKKGSELTLGIAFPELGFVQSVDATGTSRRFYAKAFYRKNSTSPDLQVIPDSNGGRARLIHARFIFTNRSRGRCNGISAHVGIMPYFNIEPQPVFSHRSPADVMAEPQFRWSD